MVSTGHRYANPAEAAVDVLRPVFKNRIISRRVKVVWPPRSCDLTPLDYYLWGAVKDKCYADKSETIYSLKDNIREAIGEIQLKYRSRRLLHGQPRQPFEWNYFSLLTGRIVHWNKKKEIWENIQKFLLKHFLKKMYLADPLAVYTVLSMVLFDKAF